MLADYQRDFIRFALDQGVLAFGDFELKSGRRSPYFFNAGKFQDGRALHRLGEYYARAVMASGLEFDLLFGPAYKGIPLATAVAVVLAAQFDINVPYVFNRKEAKDHGEKGLLVGAPLEGRVVIVDDVITAGTAIREVLDLVKASPASAVGALVAIDRQERGQGERSAIQEVEAEYGLSVVSVVNLGHIVAYLSEQGGHADTLDAMEKYREQYGI